MKLVISSIVLFVVSLNSYAVNSKSYKAHKVCYSQLTVAYERVVTYFSGAIFGQTKQELASKIAKNENKLASSQEIVKFVNRMFSSNENYLYKLYGVEYNFCIKDKTLRTVNAVKQCSILVSLGVNLKGYGDAVKNNDQSAKEKAIKVIHRHVTMSRLPARVKNTLLKELKTLDTKGSSSFRTTLESVYAKCASESQG